MSQNGVNAGRDNKLYINSRPDLPLGGSGSYNSPSWHEVIRIGDVDVSDGKQAIEIDIRESENTISQFASRNREVTFTYYKQKGAEDLAFNTLLASFEDGLALDIALAEGNILVPATYNVRAPFVVQQMEKGEPIEGVEIYDLTLNEVYAPIFFSLAGIGALEINNTFVVGPQ
jgi:hypothetical protein